jgi:hypothetical protein
MKNFAFEKQFSIAKAELEALGMHNWTDFNSHDPGITILEQVCYALTDLGYRIDFPLPDLLLGEDGRPPDTLFTPAQSLPTHAVTRTDLRKLLIDIAGVKNAWVEPVTYAPQDTVLNLDPGDQTLVFDDATQVEEPLQLKGLFHVTYETWDFGDSAQLDKDQIAQEVITRLHAHRLLGHDFTSVRELTKEPITVGARIEIGAVDTPELVMLELLKRLQTHISPTVQFHTLPEMLAAGKPIAEIFAGPRLAHGFIDTAQLQTIERRTELRTSDLLREMMDVPGVKLVRNIKIAGITEEAQNWLLPLDRNKAAVLKIPPSQPIAVGSDPTPPAPETGDNNPPLELTLERNGIPIPVDMTWVRAAFFQWQNAAAGLRPQQKIELDKSFPAGRYREVDQYHAIQHQFPANYGIGALGLSSSASPRRQAQAKQLKAYLLFFDQLLADHFAQLANAGTLFSTENLQAPTYFTQPITDPTLGIADILPPPDPTNPPPPASVADLQRRNRFLNHLLARFAEEFTDFSPYPQTGKSPAESKAAAKAAFLRDYPSLSSRRGTGMDYLQEPSSINQSGLQARINAKLGLAEGQEDFLLVEHILLRPLTTEDSGDTKQTVPILQGNDDTPLPRDPYSLRLSLFFPLDRGRFTNANFRQHVARMVREETPAHLAVRIQGVSGNDFDALTASYAAWLQALRSYWKAHWGIIV